MDLQVLPTHVYGPTPQHAGGLLLGRNNITMKEIIVAPGVIDSDYRG
jgi:dUTPase